MGAGAGAAAAAARGRRRQGGRRDAAAPRATPSPASQETGGRWRSWPRRRPLSAAAANELRRGGGGRRSRARRGAGGRRFPPPRHCRHRGRGRRGASPGGPGARGQGAAVWGLAEVGRGWALGVARQAAVYCGDPDGPVRSQARGSRASERGSGVLSSAGLWHDAISSPDRPLLSPTAKKTQTEPPNSRCC